ncbi:MAG: hypothetical protein ACNS62_24280 [Candidatus Cyclobacteriaceae bacterium M3_2C_046]
MKTENYNPSKIEVDFAKAIVDLKAELESKLQYLKIEHIKEELGADNPVLKFYLRDQDQDAHELVIRVIQRSDEMIKK